MILLALILAGVLIYTEYRITSFNMHVPWNGYGCIESVLAGQSVAPMQYRILIPAICSLWKSVRFYVAVKAVGIWFALAAFGYYCRSLGLDGYVGILFLAAVLPAFFLFDYADCYYELGLLALGLTVSMRAQQYLPWLVIITLLACLNRETGVLIPICYTALTGGIVGGAMLMGVALVGLIIPRAYYGKKARYCSPFMFRRNFFDLQKRFSVEHILFFVLLGWFVVVGVMGHTGPLYWVMASFVPAMMIPSVWTEIRVFMPVLLVTIPATF